MRVWIGCLLGLITLTGCGVDADDDRAKVPIADTPLSGMVGGRSWTWALAETDAFLSEGEPYFFVDVSATPGTACAAGFPEGDQLMLKVPREPGDYGLSSDRTAIFLFETDDENRMGLVTFEGRIVVEEVSEELIRGGAYLQRDADNSVNGRFEATICP